MAAATSASRVSCLLCSREMAADFRWLSAIGRSLTYESVCENDRSHTRPYVKSRAELGSNVGAAPALPGAAADHLGLHRHGPASVAARARLRAGAGGERDDRQPGRSRARAAAG